MFFRYQLIFYCFISMVLCLSADKPEIDKGKLLFEQNCMACHHLNTMVVGPSLAEIAHIYKANPKGIVLWSMNPGKKRALTISMPPMSHVGEEGLSNIADYIFSATKGITYKKVKQADPYASFPKAKILRGFMPNAGPAAIAVSLKDDFHFCWDAGSCQLRYTWKGGFVDPWAMLRGNGSSQIKILGDILVTLEQQNPFDSLEKIKFKGYKRVNDQPVFKYETDGGTIEVSFEVLNQYDLAVTYKCDLKENFSFKPKLSKGIWEFEQKIIKTDALSLTPEKGKQFTIVYREGDNS